MTRQSRKKRKKRKKTGRNSVGTLRINDEEVRWPDDKDDVVAAALKESSHVAGKTTQEIIDNWGPHEAASYRESVIGWLANKVKADALGTAMADAEAAKEAAEESLKADVTVEKVAAAAIP